MNVQSTTKTHTWIGNSGKTYQYWIYPIGTSFKPEPGNYIYAKYGGSLGWVAAYVGQTGNLRERLSNHPEEPCARRHGATHIHARVNSGGEMARRNEESDVIIRHLPPCNQRQ